VPDLSAVPGEWRSLLGGDRAAASRFIVPTKRIAGSVKSTVPGRTCIHEIRKFKGEYLEVCPDGCKTATRSRDEVTVHRLDVAGFTREIAESLDIVVLPAEPVPSMACVWQIGEYAPSAGYRFPVCLALTGEPDVLRSIVDGLAARGEPFILVEPTRSGLTQTTADLLKRAGSLFLSLDELVGDGDGRLSLRDGHTAAGVFAEFRAVHVPEPETADGTAFFPTPSAARWEDVSIRFIDGETISVKVKDVARICLFSELGMCDGRNKKPTKQWELLRDFAEEHGIIDWKSRKAGREKQKRREILAKDLRRFFRIDEDPFIAEGNGWRARFTVSNGD
jgi:hypothetical protein